MNNIDTILFNGHEISFEIIPNQNGNNIIKAISDRTARILSIEIDKAGRLVHSLERGLKGTSLETKRIIGGTARKEIGALRVENNRVGTFERYEKRCGIGGTAIKNVSKYDSGLQIEEEINSFGGNNSSYMKKVNGVPAFSMTRTNDGVVLTRYDREGNKLRDFSYDKNGKPVGNNGINFPGVPGYEALDSIDMNNPYMFEDLISNDFIQNIGIPRDMRDTVRNVEQIRYKEMPMVRAAKDAVIAKYNENRDAKSRDER